jgi:tight adherence protein B
MSQDVLIFAIAILAFVAVAGLGFVFSGNVQTNASSKRIKQVAHQSERVAKGRSAKDIAAIRRKQVQDTVKGLREKEKKRKEDSKPRTIKQKIARTGLSITVPTFWIASVALGVGATIAAFIAGLNIMIAAGVGFAAFLGLPRWVLDFLIASRQKKFVSQFADAIDVIVRGVKSGLPLIECLRVIARESPEPLRMEFERVTDAIQMGSPVDQALNRMYVRMPLPEVNFFNIVLAIQAKAGGNLSEALGNLSTVLRSRKMLREKIKALSSEAKASAMIIGSLPPAVMVMVYITTPSYIMELFIHPVGHMILLGAGTMMATGIYVMRRMINFNF